MFFCVFFKENRKRKIRKQQRSGQCVVAESLIQYGTFHKRAFCFFNRACWLSAAGFSSDAHEREYVTYSARENFRLPHTFPALPVHCVSTGNCQRPRDFFFNSFFFFKFLYTFKYHFLQVKKHTRQKVVINASVHANKK